MHLDVATLQALVKAAGGKDKVARFIRPHKVMHAVGWHSSLDAKESEPASVRDTDDADVENADQNACNESQAASPFSPESKRLLENLRVSYHALSQQESLLYSHV